MTADTYHHGDLRSALVRAGMEILERDGVDALTLRAAARAAGVSHAAPARHFADAASFLAAIAAVGFGSLSEVLARARATAVDPVVGLREMGLAYVRFATERPELYRVIFHPTLADKQRHPELLVASAEAFEVLRAGVSDALISSPADPEHVDRVALTAWATVHGIATLMIDDQLLAKGYAGSSEAIATMVLAELWTGIGS